MGHVLTLHALETFDPQAPDRGRERRFCCPLCGSSKSLDAGHRSLAVNTETSLWHCHRCGAKGKLGEAWQDRTHDNRWRAREGARRAFTLTPPARLKPAAPAASTPQPGWRIRLQGLQPLAGTAGADYLASRGIPVEVAHAAGVRHHPLWYDRAPAVVFPIRDRSGTLVAAQGRFLRDDVKPKTQTAGPSSTGAFTTFGAWDADPLVLVEAPIDALSLALCGGPAIALIGKELRDWAAWACALRRVLIATDADEAGDSAWAKAEPILRARGARAERFRPTCGKDWNDGLQRDAEGLCAAVAEVRKPPQAPGEWKEDFE